MNKKVIMNTNSSYAGQEGAILKEGDSSYIIQLNSGLTLQTCKETFDFNNKEN